MPPGTPLFTEGDFELGAPASIAVAPRQGRAPLAKPAPS